MSRNYFMSDSVGSVGRALDLVSTVMGSDPAVHLAFLTKYLDS